ncbi:hypothetical protein R50072_30570 [Simiduia litorea]
MLCEFVHKLTNPLSLKRLQFHDLRLHPEPSQKQPPSQPEKPYKNHNVTKQSETKEPLNRKKNRQL